MLKIRHSAACGLFLRVTSHFCGLTKKSSVFPSEDLCAKAHCRVDLRLTKTAIGLLGVAQAFQ
jgi:hypothetical protein